MMEKHNVDLAEVLKRQGKQHDCQVTRMRAHETSKIDRWMKRMISTVVLITDAQAYTSKTFKFAETKSGRTAVYEVWFYGDPTDVEAACSLYLELLVVFRTMARHHLGAKWTQAHYHYMEGFGCGMIVKLQEDRERTARERTVTTTGLIVSKHNAIKRFAEETLKLTYKTPKAVRKSETNSSAYSQGKEDGYNYGRGPAGKIT